MGCIVFHYTSRQGAQEIVIGGVLRAGRSDRVYLTDDVYDRGSEAAKSLAIVGKTVEVVFTIPDDSVPDATDPRLVDEIFDAYGVSIRPGGGTERWVDHDIEIDDRVVAWNLAWG